MPHPWKSLPKTWYPTECRACGCDSIDCVCDCTAADEPLPADIERRIERGDILTVTKPWFTEWQTMKYGWAKVE